MANASCLAAARDALLDEHGWDVQRDGLFGAPEIHVVIGEKAHSTLRKSLGLIGLGRERVTIVPADDQGRMRADDLPPTCPDGAPVLVCAQAGEVNTGAFDPFARDRRLGGGRATVGSTSMVRSVCGRSPTRVAPHLVDGLRPRRLVGHRRPQVAQRHLRLRHRDRPTAGALRRTFAAVAGYLPPDDGFEAMHHTPQSSQRARQIEVWAVLRTLGPLGRRRPGADRPPTRRSRSPIACEMPDSRSSTTSC